MCFFPPEEHLKVNYAEMQPATFVECFVNVRYKVYPNSVNIIDCKFFMAQENWTLEMDGPGPKVGRVEWVLFEAPHSTKKTFSLFLPKKQKYYYYNR